VRFYSVQLGSLPLNAGRAGQRGPYCIGMSCSSTLAHRRLVGRVAWMRPIRSGWSRSIRGPHRCRRHGSTRPLIA